jgi:hypothetical protein
LWWRGGALDRLLDRRHAGIGEHVVRVLLDDLWLPSSEVTFAEYRENGSIDVLGVRPDLLAASVFEVKSDITSVEETFRRFDVKIRLAPTIVRKTFGFTPEGLGAVLVLPDVSTARRRVAEHDATFRTRYPARGWEIRRWLQQPSGPLRGLWFLSEIARDDAKRRPPTPDRSDGRVRGWIPPAIAPGDQWWRNTTARPGSASYRADHPAQHRPWRYPGDRRRRSGATGNRARGGRRIDD